MANSGGSIDQRQEPELLYPFSGTSELRSIPFCMNGASRQLNSPDCYLSIRAVDCHHYCHTISDHTLDHWCIPFEDLERCLLNGVEDTDGNLDKLTPVRDLVDIFPKRPEHHTLTNGSPVLPEQFDSHCGGQK